MSIVWPIKNDPFPQMPHFLLMQFAPQVQPYSVHISIIERLLYVLLLFFSMYYTAIGAQKSFIIC